MRNLLILAVAAAVSLPVFAGDCRSVVQSLPQAAASYSYSQSTVIERVQTPVVYDVAPAPCTCVPSAALSAASYYPSQQTSGSVYSSSAYYLPSMGVPSYRTDTVNYISRNLDVRPAYIPHAPRYLGPPIRETVYDRPPVRDIGRAYYPPREIVRERVPGYYVPRERIREVPIERAPSGVFANLRARTADGAGRGGLFGAVEGLTGVGDGSGQFLQGAVIARFLPGGGGFRFKR